MADAPPVDINDDAPPPITNRYPRYPDTPMPDDDDDESVQEEFQPETSPFYKKAMFVAIVAMFISHLISMWTLSADVNILMAYQKEHAEQYKHIAHLLENMHQVKWQMVPAI